MTPENRLNFEFGEAVLHDGRRVTLRFLLPSDGSLLTRFYQRILRKDYRFYSPHPLSREHAHRKAATLADSASFICLVAETDTGEFGGYVWIEWQTGQDEAELGICVEPDYQSSGLGRALILNILEIAKRAGPPQLRLSVQLANAKALELYRKVGFEIIDSRVRGAFEEFSDEPEYVMRRSMASGRSVAMT